MSGRIRGQTIPAPRAELSVVRAAAGRDLPCASHPEHVRVSLIESLERIRLLEASWRAGRRDRADAALGARRKAI